MPASAATPQSPSDAAELARLVGASQQRVVDYALGLGILGMFPAWLSPVLVLAVLLLVGMLWDIGRRWRWSWPRNPITLIGAYLNVLGAFAVALLSWTALVLLGVWIPLIDHYALAAALLCGAWTLGAAANQFFLQGHLRRYRGRPTGAIHG
jgi:hypothetical protein